MKNQVGLILSVILCVGLIIALVTSKKKAADQQRADAETITVLSNKWVDTSANLDEQKQVATLLERDLEVQKKALSQLTNDYTQLAANLTKTEGTLKVTEEEIKKREARITELESQNQALETQKVALDKQALDLSTAITNLQSQIAMTEKKLASAEGDKAFLEKELKRLTSEKSELERQFNDLAVLRAQVAKLKEELNVARRVEWIRQGLFAATEQKGGQRLMQGFNVAQSKPAVKPTYDLNVEVTSDGSVKVLSTNQPATTNRTQ
jgi:chromosome segregation ATPase